MSSFHCKPASRRGFLRQLGVVGLTAASGGEIRALASNLAATEARSAASDIAQEAGTLLAGGAFPAVISKVAPYQGRPAIYINGRPVAPMLYALTMEGRYTWQPEPHHHLEEYAGIGFKMFQFEVWFYDIWKKDGSLDMATVRRQLDGVISACPDALIFIRVHVDPPFWWSAKYPEEGVEYTIPVTKRGQELLSRGRMWWVSAASVRWRNDASGMLIKFLHDLSAMREGNYIAGFHVSGLFYGEWHYQQFWYEPDSGPAMTKHFRGWLREKYGTDKSLQQAWHDFKVTLETATVPNIEERTHTCDGMFRDPQKEHRVIDYYHCHQQTVGDDILHFTHLVKTSWRRPTIVGVFYSYFFGMVEMPSATTAGGDLQVRRILDSRDIDYVSGPFSYAVGARKLGGTGEFRCVYDSVRLHNKLWMCEVDEPSDLNNPRHHPSGAQYAQTDTETIAQNRRNFAYVLTHGAGMWWYDFGPKGLGGWWDRPDLLADIERMRKLDAGATQKPEHSVADVLIVYDTNVFYQLAIQRARKDPISYGAIDGMSNSAYHTGAAIDQVLLADLPRVHWGRYKVIIFANTFLLTDLQEYFIKDQVAKFGRTLVWIYAPGYTDGVKLRGVERVSSVVGMKLKEVDFSSAPHVVVHGGGKYLHGLSLEFGELKKFPPANLGGSTGAWDMVGPVHPLFAISDPSVTALGFYAKTKAIAFGVKTLRHTTSVFCGMPFYDPALMRAVFRQSGVHIYNDSGDVLVVDNNYLAIHTLSGGERKLLLRNGKQVGIHLPPISTQIYDAQDGRPVLK